MPSYNINDRRTSARVFLRVAVVCEFVDPKSGSPTKKTILSQDLSSEGIYLEMDEILPLGMEINVVFQLPGAQNSIRATARVSRMETVEEGKLFGIGVTFVKIADKDKREIQELIERSDIRKLMGLTIKHNASDLHLTTNFPPVMRINGELNTLDMPNLTENDIPILIYSLMSKHQIKQFDSEKELTFGYQYDLQNRFRVNVHQQRGFLEAALRLINVEISSFEELRIPEVVKDFCNLQDGLVLIVGPTGSGKTTTVAAMVELINSTKKAMVVTLERPIEYIHVNKKSIIKQREVGVDTLSFSAALRNSLKQDPDILVIGELDDTETIKTSMIAAEAGHLVIVTFHGPNTVQAIDRLANMFPPENRRQVLFQLSQCIKGIVTQLLIPRKDKKGRVLSTELVVTNDAVKKVIRNDELIQLPTIIQTGSAFKMRSMPDSVMQLVEQGFVEMEVANTFNDEFSRYR